MRSGMGCDGYGNRIELMGNNIIGFSTRYFVCSGKIFLRVMEPILEFCDEYKGTSGN